MSLQSVKVWEEKVVIPTYPIGIPEKVPMFLEKRVYQGSSGVVYPHPVIEKIFDEKINKEYNALFLENEYLKIMVLPELGGRIQMAYDKTADYHFIYYNKVIKPALVGLAGPWIAGGLEFNWPQHHRPSTFEPVDFAIEEGADGSKTVWVSELEKMFRTKGAAGFTLYPDKAYLEIKGKLYNGTAQPQTFLWWANPAVSVDEHYQSVFPPDVHAVFDHGKRDVSSFPIATGTYYKVDYSAGVDISRYKNIPVPTSYMAIQSDYDFVGGYHHQKRAGILHVADHHISPGKKQWTWGTSDFGQAWERNLTDEDGPYIELMTGVFTDNQPDFSWIQPFEEKTFTQYFLPYKELGVVKNATKNALVNLEIESGKATVKVYVTAVQTNLKIVLNHEGNTFWQTAIDLSPQAAFSTIIDLPQHCMPENLCVKVINAAGKELVAYQPQKSSRKLPEAAKPLLAPKDIKSNEQLFFAGQHLEQYRHANYNPVDYYSEALKREPGDARCNNAMGLWWLRKGQFQKSISYFREAIHTLTERNPNPYDGEPYYNLGVALVFLNRLDEAYDSLYKATWNAAWQDSAFFLLAQIKAHQNDDAAALELVEKSLLRNSHHHKARHLKTILLRKLNRHEEARHFALASLQIDPFNFGVLYELYLLQKAQNLHDKATETLSVLKTRMRNNSHSYIETAIDYAGAHFYSEASDLLNEIVATSPDPLVQYYIAYYYARCGEADKAKTAAHAAAVIKGDYCFPNRLHDIKILKHAQLVNPDDGKAAYYLGNLWYDKRQYDEAIKSWEVSVTINPAFSIVHRNLALAYFNKRKDPSKARLHLEKAFELDNSNARILFELDGLYKRLQKPHQDRLQLLEAHPALVEWRDDLYLERIILYNQLGETEKAKAALACRKFHPWEGGEGKVTGQYVLTQVELAKTHLQSHRYRQAITELEAAQTYPHHLGEGKLYGAQENDVHYFLGCAYEGLGDRSKATTYFHKASEGPDEPAAAIFYNDQPPEKIFYQGLAKRRLLSEKEAQEKFQKLIDYGDAHITDAVTMDYFAVSLPDMLIFDDDLDKRNKLHCLFMKGLGYLGLHELEAAANLFQQVLSYDINHIGASIHLKMVEEQAAATH